jgi:hypothetical protein
MEGFCDGGYKMLGSKITGNISAEYVLPKACNLSIQSARTEHCDWTCF